MLSQINYKFLENSNLYNAFTNYGFELSDVIHDTLWTRYCTFEFFIFIEFETIEFAL